MPFESFEEFDPRGYFLRHVADNIALPVAVRFIGDTKFSPEARVALKGEFRFEEIVEESIVIATTKLRDEFTILKLPVDLQITLLPIRKLRCNAEYMSKYWERLKLEIDKLETQITNVEDDLLPMSYFQENTPSVGLEGSGDSGYHKAMIVSIVNEYASAPHGDRHVYEAMKPSILDMQDRSLERPEETEDYYEAIELPTTRKVCEYIPVPGECEDENVAMETSIARELGEYHMPLLQGCEHVYEAMKPSKAHKFREGLLCSRPTDSKITKGLRGKSLNSSVASFPRDRIPCIRMKNLQQTSAGKLQDPAERIKTKLTG